MAVNEQDLDHLLQGLQKVDPRLHELLTRLVDTVSSMKRDLEPLVQQSLIRESGVVDITPPINATYILDQDTVNLIWESGDERSRSYEIRQGTDWATANFITVTPTTNVHIYPSPGSPLVYLIKAIDLDNNKSLKTTTVIVEVELPGATPLGIEVVDNNVFLRWTPPASSFSIKTYEVYKGTEFLGSREGTFTSFFEQVAGDYTYRIFAVDVAGNRGTETKLTVHVKSPPDYILTAVHLSLFSGFKFHVKAYTDPTITQEGA